ncbi:MAG: prepilin-type N-terminal cleavage/methylation domain-containing protein [Polyangiaceae bacterium]|nr:prepilin-type N-terminal cleavage/methylation domain-containing protein [Polyangiaceae bacterium]
MRRPQLEPSRLRRIARPRRGFTLVELMVAITGGLLVSIVVFALARDATRFYKRESRIGDATLGTVIGFERLRAEIARAGFLASANIRSDASFCGDSAALSQLPGELSRLASVRIIQDATTGNPVLQANGLSPDAIVLAGSFQATDQFPIWGVSADASGGAQVFLQARIGPLARRNYLSGDLTARTALLQGLFPAQRALRIVDEAGRVQYGIIAGSGDAIADPANGAEPFITLAAQPALIYRAGAATVCGLKSNELGVVSVVNFVRYDVRSLSGVAGYSPLYAENLGATPFDTDRTELVRSELLAGQQDSEIAGTAELVAERAVDLKFGLTVVAPNSALTTLPPGNGGIGDYAGDVTGVNVRPERIRAVRVRLSVRSGEPDRAADVDPDAGPGLYRINLGAQGGLLPFARVRTLQADVVLPNQGGQ